MGSDKSLGTIDDVESISMAIRMVCRKSLSFISIHTVDEVTSANFNVSY